MSSSKGAGYVLTREQLMVVGAKALLTELDTYRKELKRIILSAKFNQTSGLTPRPKGSPLKGRKLSPEHRAAIARGKRRARRIRNAENLKHAAERHD